MRVDTLIIKMDIRNEFLEESVYDIKIDYNKCVQIISINQGVLYEECDDFLKGIDGEFIPAIYKGISRIDNWKIFLISPVQIRRQIKLRQIL